MTTMVATEGALEIRGLKEDDEQAWDAFVRRTCGGTFFHLLGWKRAVEKVFGHEAHYLLAGRDGEISGVLPLFRVRSPFIGTNLISIPYAVYGGPIAAEPAVRRALVEEAHRIAKRCRVGCIELRHREEPVPDEAPGTDLYCTFVRELPAEPEGCLGMLPKKARAAARQGRDRYGLELGEGRWYLRDFYRFFHINKRSLGSPGLPLAWFRALLEEFGESCVIHVVRKDLLPVAAVMSFRYGEELLPYYSGKLGEANQWNVDNFLYWQLMEYGVRRGHRIFDFGRSRRDTGAFRFKSHQGFEPTPLHYRYHLIRRKRPPHFNPSNPRLNLPRRLWSRLPLWLSKALSNPLSSYLP